MASEEIFFDQIRSSGCLSYILGCKQDRVCVVIDPEIDKADDYVELARFFGSTVLYAIDYPQLTRSGSGVRRRRR